MRVVFDTVVLVRGVISPSSWSGRLLFDRRHRYRLVVSPDIVGEYLTVLRRPVLVRKFGIPEPEVFRVVEGLVDAGLVVEPIDVPRVCRDPNDDKFLAAALAGNAQFIVSEDDDLLVLGSYEGIEIVPARHFLAVLE